MSDKPKRWTWEDFDKFIEYNNGDKFSDLAAEKVMSAFHANEPLIDWQEKEIERLKKEVDEAYNRKLYSRRKLEFDNKELKQCIAEWEKDFRKSMDEALRRDIMKDETIDKLKEALEKINKLDLSTTEYYATDDALTQCGETVRNVLKECFGEEE